MYSSRTSNLFAGKALAFMQAALQSKVEQATSQRVIDSAPVSGGYSSDAFKVSLDDGAVVFCKTAPSSQMSFPCEASGLDELRKVEDLHVPKVIFCDQDMLVLEYIERGRPSSHSYRDFGRSIARMHQMTSEHYGFYQDNFIGAMPQKNTPQKTSEDITWAEFFYEYRLVYQLKLAEKRGLSSQALSAAVAKLSDKIIDLLPDDGEKPCLIHGDMWGGNHVADSSGKIWLFDPAVYYGHREAEMALTYLFSGFNSDFYRGYDEVSPLGEGWQDRQPLYQAYHLLNHLNMMGRSYHDQALASLRCYL